MGTLEVAGKLIERQHSSGAVHEYVNASCHLGFLTSNANYGEAEGGLMAQNTDPVADLLYTQNFALMSLHEAAHAVGPETTEGRRYSRAEDALAGFLVRAQVRSEAQPNLDGGWLRGMDLGGWEYYASATDSGYGPWETETGCGQHAPDGSRRWPSQIDNHTCSVGESFSSTIGVTAFSLRQVDHRVGRRHAFAPGLEHIVVGHHAGGCAQCWQHGGPRDLPGLFRRHGAGSVRCSGGKRRPLVLRACWRVRCL